MSPFTCRQSKNSFRRRSPFPAVPCSRFDESSISHALNPNGTEFDASLPGRLLKHSSGFFFSVLSTLILQNTWYPGAQINLMRNRETERPTLQRMRSASSSSRLCVTADAGLEEAGDNTAASPSAPPPRTLFMNSPRELPSVGEQQAAAVHVRCRYNRT